jgi:Siphovirus Gp157.
MNQPLYKIKQNYLQAIDEMVFNENDIDYQSMSDTLTAIQDEFKEKAINIASYIKNLDSSINEMKKYENNMKTRRSKLDNAKSNLIVYLRDNMIETSLTKIESTEFNISLRKSPPTLFVENEDLIPQEYFDVIKMLNHKKLKKDIQENPIYFLDNPIEGVQIVSRRHIVIK